MHFLKSVRTGRSLSTQPNPALCFLGIHIYFTYLNNTSCQFKRRSHLITSDSHFRKMKISGKITRPEQWLRCSGCRLRFDKPYEPDYGKFLVGMHIDSSHAYMMLLLVDKRRKCTVFRFITRNLIVSKSSAAAHPT